MKYIILFLILTTQVCLAHDFNFINLRLRSGDRATPIEQFSRVLTPDLIKRLKSVIYTRFRAEYHDLESLPPERFQETFTFDIDLNWWDQDQGGANLLLFIKDSPAHLSQHPIRVANKNPAEFIEEDVSTGTWNILPQGFINHSNHSLNAILDSTALKADMPIELLQDLIWRVASKASFSNQLPPQQLRTEILTRSPELEMFVGGLMERLRLVLQNPNAFEAELVAQAFTIEKKLTELSNNHRITREQETVEILKLRKDTQDLESRAQAARSVVAQTALQAEALKPIMDSILRGSTIADFSVIDQLGNIEVFNNSSTPSLKKAQSEINAVINGILNQGLQQILLLKNSQWNSIYSSLEIEAKILGVETIKGRRRIFVANEPDSYKIKMGVHARARTHSYGDHRGLTTLVFSYDKGQIKIEDSSQVDLVNFFQDVEKLMDDLVLKERTTPAGNFIAQLLQRGVTVDQIAEALKTGRPVVVCEDVLLPKMQ